MPFRHILDRAWNTPLRIREDKLAILNDKVFIHLFNNVDAIDKSMPVSEQKAAEPASTDVMVIPIEGTLVQKRSNSYSGMTSYQWITNAVNTAVADGYKNIILDINSPGGEVFGNDTCSKNIAKHVANGINIVAYVDGQACSAAYAIASACKTIYSTQASMLGSIGTIMTLVDVTKADAKAGISYEIIRSKPKKALYNPHESITQAVIDKQTSILEEMDSQFNTLVSSVRPKVTSKLIAKLEGDVVMANEAIAIGLADEIVDSLDSLLATLGTSADVEDEGEGDIPELEVDLDNLDKTSTTLNKTKEFNMPDITGAIPSDLPSALQIIAGLQAQVNTAKNETAMAVQTAILTERERCHEITKASAGFRLPMANVVSAITKGHPLDVVAEIFTAQAQAVALETQISGGAEGALQATVGATKAKEGLDLTSIIKAQLGLGTVGLEQQSPAAGGTVKGTDANASEHAKLAGVDVRAVQEAMQLSAEDFNL